MRASLFKALRSSTLFFIAQWKRFRKYWISNSPRCSKSRLTLPKYILVDGTYHNMLHKNLNFRFLFTMADEEDNKNITHWHSSHTSKRPNSTEESEILEIYFELKRHGMEILSSSYIVRRFLQLSKLKIKHFGKILWRTRPIHFQRLSWVAERTPMRKHWTEFASLRANTTYLMK